MNTLNACTYEEPQKDGLAPKMLESFVNPEFPPDLVQLTDEASV